MIIYIDIDDTICHTFGLEYDKAEPIIENINKFNKLYDQGHTIVYWTARGTVIQKNWFKTTVDQFERWAVKYTEIRMGKPNYDLFIDDKSINSIWDLDSIDKFDKVNK